MPMEQTSQDADFILLTYKDLDLDRLERGPYLDMPSYLTCNGENPDVTGADISVHMQSEAFFRWY